MLKMIFMKMTQVSDLLNSNFTEAHKKIETLEDSNLELVKQKLDTDKAKVEKAKIP